eukprot:comp20675_c0_seq1/m.26857 comp20675_c0_seq1/g.26857  ORF comp20675_c0_seq1/g.26857 comp20675_c0_seq1/m.26857 type:complete len:676 (-) comp20675_c0_seq1:31-2058(-)
MAFFASSSMLFRTPTPLERLTKEESAELHEKWGEDTVSSLASEAQALFLELDKCRDGKLELREFSQALGVMGCNNSPLSNLLFQVLDINGDGRLSFFEFFSWMLLMLHGSLEDKLAFGYRLMDIDHDNCITREEMIHTLQSLFSVMTSLRMEAPNLTEFVNTLWEKFDIHSDKGITMEEYKEGALRNMAFIRSFGMSEDIAQHNTHQASTAGGVRVFFGQQKWDVMLSVMCSLQLSMDKIRLEPRVNMADFTDREFAKLRQVDKFDVPAKEYTRVTVNSYWPQVFREIRYMSGIDDDSFLDSIGVKQVIGSLLMGDLTTMSGLVSQGKSNSYFFYSHDGRYMIKTVSRGEYYTLREMAIAYYRHLLDNPNSLLTRFYGLFKLKEAAETYFVVMNNLFNTPRKMDLRFDLKGSTVGRTSRNEQVTDFMCPHVIYKDLDWIGSMRKLPLSPKITPSFWNMVEKDSQFLRDHSIIDYSLLVGIQYRHTEHYDRFVVWKEENEERLKAAYELLNPPDSKGPRDGKLFDLMDFDSFVWTAFNNTSDKGNEGCPPPKYGFSPTKSFRVDDQGHVQHGEEILYVGIIDTLISYGAWKRGEHLAKSLFHGKEVSVVPPTDYHHRFLKFVRTQVLKGLPALEIPDPIFDDLSLATPISSASRRFSSTPSRSSTTSLSVPPSVNA